MCDRGRGVSQKTEEEEKHVEKYVDQTEGKFYNRQIEGRSVVSVRTGKGKFDRGRTVSKETG